MRKRFVGGNWKCNNNLTQTKQLIANLNTYKQTSIDLVVAPVFLHIPLALQNLQQHVQVAAQNCSSSGYGAFTGQISPLHLKDLGINWVILGHSQRRTLYGQTDQIIGKKIQQALKVGLKVIACFGQTLAQRQSGKTYQVVNKQLQAFVVAVKQNWNNIVLAYQPVWAIGTGKTATSDQVKDVHLHIRNFLQKHIKKQSQSIRIIYGGSVTQKNCVELIAVENVDGFLVGGASLKPAFNDIIKACL